MINWLLYPPSVDVAGTELLTELAKEYISLTSESVNLSCRKCVKSYQRKVYEHYKNKTKMAKSTKKDGEYLLHDRFEGFRIPGTGIHVYNGELTGDVLERLLAVPGVEKMFAVMPKKSGTPVASTVNHTVPVADPVVTIDTVDTGSDGEGDEEFELGSETGAENPSDDNEFEL